MMIRNVMFFFIGVVEYFYKYHLIDFFKELLSTLKRLPNNYLFHVAILCISVIISIVFRVLELYYLIPWSGVFTILYAIYFVSKINKTNAFGDPVGSKSPEWFDLGNDFGYNNIEYLKLINKMKQLTDDDYRELANDIKNMRMRRYFINDQRTT